jgi:hypothetical protein
MQQLSDSWKPKMKRSIEGGNVTGKSIWMKV